MTETGRSVYDTVIELDLTHDNEGQDHQETMTPHHCTNYVYTLDLQVLLFTGTPMKTVYVLVRSQWTLYRLNYYVITYQREEETK